MEIVVGKFKAGGTVPPDNMPLEYASSVSAYVEWIKSIKRAGLEGVEMEVVLRPCDKPVTKRDKRWNSTDSETAASD